MGLDKKKILKALSFEGDRGGGTTGKKKRLFRQRSSQCYPVSVTNNGPLGQFIRFYAESSASVQNEHLTGHVFFAPPPFLYHGKQLTFSCANSLQR